VAGVRAHHTQQAPRAGAGTRASAGSDEPSPPVSGRSASGLGSLSGLDALLLLGGLGLLALIAVTLRRARESRPTTG
jgi:hypothetical protein